MDPDLSQWYRNLQANVTYRLQAKIVGYDTVGSGSFSILSPTEIAFSGSYDIPGIANGNVELNVTVTGENQGSFVFNGASGSCTFKVTSGDPGPYLHLDPENYPQYDIQFQWWDDGIWIGGEGPPVDLWIGS